MPRCPAGSGLLAVLLAARSVPDPWIKRKTRPSSKPSESVCPSAPPHSLCSTRCGEVRCGSTCSPWPLSCALGVSVGAGPRLFRRVCEPCGLRINGARWLTVTVPLPGHLPFGSACPLDANCWCRRLARAPGTVLAVPQIWVSARWISCLGPASMERQVTGVAGHRRSWRHSDEYTR